MDDFITQLEIFIGLEVSKDQPKMWAEEWLSSMKEEWSPVEPPKPADESDKDEMDEWREEHKEWRTNMRTKWPAAKLQVWSTIMGQCSKKLQGTITSMEEYKKAKSGHNYIKLLKLLK